MHATVKLPSPMNVNGKDVSEVRLAAPSYNELVEAGDFVSPLDIDGTISVAGQRHNKQTLSRLIPVCLNKVDGQAVSQISTQNLSIENGIRLSDALERLLGKRIRLARPDEAEEEDNNESE